MTFSPERPVWVVFSRMFHNLSVPSNLEKCLLPSARLHLDMELDKRLEFIIQEYDYIIKDERAVEQAVDKIQMYAGLKEDNNWEEILEK